jgi:hypothetical protein
MAKLDAVCPDVFAIEAFTTTSVIICVTGNWPGNSPHTNAMSDRLAFFSELRDEVHYFIP